MLAFDPTRGVVTKEDVADNVADSIGPYPDQDSGAWRRRTGDPVLQA